MADHWQRTQRTNRTGKKLTKSKDLLKEIADDRAWHGHGLWKSFMTFGVYLLMVACSAAVLVLGGTGVYLIAHAIKTQDFGTLNGLMAQGWELAQNGAVALMVGQGIFKKKE